MTLERTEDARVHRQVVLGTASNYIGKFLTLATWFFLTPFILHRLGPVYYGLLALAGGLAGYSSVLLDFGMSAAVVRYLSSFRSSGKPELANALIATSFRLYACLGLVALALSGAVAYILPKLFVLSPAELPSARAAVLLFGVGAALTLPCSVVTNTLGGLQRYDLLSLVTTGGTILGAIGTVVVLLVGWGIEGVVAVNIPQLFITTLWSAWLVRRVAPDVRIGFRGARRSMVSQIASFSSSNFILQVTWLLEVKTDEIVIGNALTVGAITPYSVALKLTSVPPLMAEQFVKVLLPLASDLEARNQSAQLRSLYLTSTRIALAILLPIGICIIVLAHPILSLWVGPEYSNPGPIVIMLGLSGIINMSQWPAVMVLQILGRHRQSAFMGLASGFTNLALSLALVRVMGVTGVALGTLIPTVIFSLGVILPYSLRVLEISFGEFLRQVALPSCLPMVAATVLLLLSREWLQPSTPLPVLIVIGAGCLTYAAGYLSMSACSLERSIISTQGRDTFSAATGQLRRMVERRSS